MKIKSLGDTDFDELFGAFRQAFADYEVQLDKDGLAAMLKRRGFAPKLSFAAFDEDRFAAFDGDSRDRGCRGDGDLIVSFTCNGIGNFYGVPTAYDTGTGTLKDYLGKGLATRVFEHSIPYLKEAGIEQYLLEVLQHNTGAVSVYSKLGFEVTREFYYFRQETGRIKSEVRAIGFPCIMRPIDINAHDEIAGFWDFNPSWQNGLESIDRSPEDFICTGVFTENRLVGYSVFEPASGDISQIAVDKRYRRGGIGSLLLQKMLESNRHDSVKIVNTDIRCDSITAFLRSKNIEPTGKQFEMVKKLHY